MIDSRLLVSLAGARRVAVLTGAGISAESGIPTFRDKLVGLWERFDPRDLATAEAFEHDPALVWGWYEWRRMMVSRAQPNPGHLALVTLAERVPELTVITQNVDDLHERAGSRDVLHLHGRLATPYCQDCKRSHPLAAGSPDIAPSGARIAPPQCEHCGGRVRPGVVWFGEGLPQDEWRRAVDAARQCQVFLCVGTSSLVQPAASLTEMAAAAGAVTIQVNPNPTAADDVVDCTLTGTAATVLPMLVTAWPCAS